MSFIIHNLRFVPLRTTEMSMMDSRDKAKAFYTRSVTVQRTMYCDTSWVTSSPDNQRQKV